MNEQKCNQCGYPVQFNNPIAAGLAVLRGVLCDECRRGGRQWTKAMYRDYLQSNHWRMFRARALAHYGEKCYLCGDTDKCIDLHHNDYSRLGGELLSDVIPLCTACHRQYHSQNLSLL